MSPFSTPNQIEILTHFSGPPSQRLGNQKPYIYCAARNSPESVKNVTESHQNGAGHRLRAMGTGYGLWVMGYGLWAGVAGSGREGYPRSIYRPGYQRVAYSLYTPPIASVVGSALHVPGTLSAGVCPAPGACAPPGVSVRQF